MKQLTRGCPPGRSRRPVRPGVLTHSRLVAGYTVAQAARIISARRKRVVKPDRIYSWESGRDAAPEWAVESLAVLYGVDPEAVFEKNLPVRRKVEA